jgi:NADH dehydrogenase
MARVEGIDLARQRVITDERPIPYDYLLLAAGSRPTFFGLEEVEDVAFTMGGIDQAIALRNHILSCFEEALRESDPAKRQALLTFVIVGAGPTGVELAGAITELERHALRHDFPDLDFGQVRIILLEMMDNVLPPYPDPLRDYARRQLEKMGIQIMLNATVEDASETLVQLKDGRTIPTHTVIWSAGVKARLSSHLPFDTQDRGRVVVTETLQVPQHPHIFVAGDMAYATDANGDPFPQLAPVAMQQGEMAARNILRLANGQSPKPFRYDDRGYMTTIGRSVAVARVFGRSFKGFVAWVLWLVVHIMYLVGFRNRLLVLINWAYNYFTFERGVRLIVGTRQARQRAD